LPHQNAIELARKRDFLYGNIHLLSITAGVALEMSRQRPGRGHHISMKVAGIQRFLDGRTIRCSCQTQHTAHGGGYELVAQPMRSRRIAAECGNRNVDEPRCTAREALWRPTQFFEASPSQVFDEKRCVCDVRCQVGDGRHDERRSE
jgi:hypothetical protein